jgi:hypothetical protein
MSEVITKVKLLFQLHQLVSPSVITLGIFIA